LEYIRPGLIDNIFTSTPFLAAVYGAYGRKKARKKGVRLVNGGERIRIPLMYGSNTSVGSYSGYDTLDVTPQEGITTAFYTWRQLAVSIAISRKEERQNAGEGKIRDLLQAKIMQAEMSLRDEINYQLLGKTVASAVWSSGSGIANQTANADLSPIPHLVCKTPTGTVTVGNIAQGTYSWWRNIAVDGSAAHASKDAAADRGFLCDDWKTLTQAMRWTYNSASKGTGGFPDLILTDQLAYESYEGAMDDKTRYTAATGTPGSPATVGFESVRFKGANMVWDEMMPDIDGGYVYTDTSNWSTSTMFFLNTDFLELVVDSGTNFITTPFVRPENQDARVAQILLMGELCCSQRKKQAVLYGITGGIFA
jgi:hypothetical protein